MAKAPTESGGALVAQSEDPNNNLPAELMDEMLAEGGGHEDFGSEDFSVPYLGIVQALSKARQKTHANYVKGAEEGQFLNSASRKLYSGEQGVYLVPFAFHHRFIAWKPDNGGIAQDYGADPTVFNSIVPVAEGKQKNKRFDGDGNEVVDTVEYFCLMVDIETGVFEPIVVTFSGGFMKKAKKWNNLIRDQVVFKDGKGIRPAIYFYVYKMTTMPESNEQGEWYSHHVELHGKVADLPDGISIFRTAKNLRKQFTAGDLKTGPIEQDADGEKAPTAF